TRANGEMYLAGFVVECLLKAGLLENFSWLQNAGSPEGRPPLDREIWFLCYRSHDLDAMLGHLSPLTRRLAAREQGGNTRLLQNLKSICGQWTIHARYSPRLAEFSEANQF